MTKKADDITLYDWLKHHDFLEWLRPLWDGGGWAINKDGKLEAIRSVIAVDTPWIHHGRADWTNCMLWSNILFNQVSSNMKRWFADGEPFVPSGCQQCYKVVVRPQTLIQLFALNDLQATLYMPSKCGMEVRNEVMGLYGGYFYNLGLEAGQDCYSIVRDAVDHEPHLGEKVPVILKRGCTEMEHLIGPSDRWEITDKQLFIEELINAWVIIETPVQEQPDSVIWHIKRRWIDWAYMNGDQTYKHFTGGKLIVPAYVTYHQEKADGLWTRMETQAERQERGLYPLRCGQDA